MNLTSNLKFIAKKHNWNDEMLIKEIGKILLYTNEDTIIEFISTLQCDCDLQEQCKFCY